MASLRNAASSPDRSADRTVQDGYLDAARACILDVGWRRTTLTEVARRAGVSRMTIYRRWSDMPQLLGDLLTREWRAVVESAPRSGDSLADQVVRTVVALRGDDFFLRIVELDPELLLPYLLARRGRSQDHALGLLEAAVTRGQADGTIRAGDPVTIARALLLALHGFVLSAHTMVDDRASASGLDAELRTLVERMLAP